ncbi:hypothetical protein FB451DRAFT_1215655 [Mycena latifolia]|nr:hypothetical protein FB451DRAFT_1215655 [Mycena latifolia]
MIGRGLVCLASALWRRVVVTWSSGEKVHVTVTPLSNRCHKTLHSVSASYEYIREEWDHRRTNLNDGEVRRAMACITSRDKWNEIPCEAECKSSTPDDR